MGGRVSALGVVVAVLGAGALAAQQDTSAGPEFVVDAALARRGQTLFNNRGCTACHAFGAKRAGPDLAGLYNRRDVDWLRRWLSSTTSMLATDSIAMAMLAEYNNTKMPDLRLRADEVEALLHFMAREDARRRGDGAR